jgi:hypothetical protein
LAFVPVAAPVNAKFRPLAPPVRVRCGVAMPGSRKVNFCAVDGAAVR